MLLIGDAPCAALYTGGCVKWALFDARVGGTGNTGGNTLCHSYAEGCGVRAVFLGCAGGHALCATLYAVPFCWRCWRICAVLLCMLDVLQVLDVMCLMLLLCAGGSAGAEVLRCVLLSLLNVLEAVLCIGDSAASEMLWCVLLYI